MFGPNTQLECVVEVSGSHRDRVFAEALFATKEAFKTRFSLQDYDILFIPGSGSVGMEAVISSLRFGAYSSKTGKFADRWRSVIANYGKSQLSGHNVYCHLETSESKVNEIPIEQQDDSIVDCISSFPYYNIPPCAVFVTCMNKQFGALSGLAIVGVRKDKWDMFVKREEWSYLNIRQYLNNIPVTFPTYGLGLFLSRLSEHRLNDVRQHIEQHSLLIQQAVGEKSLIGCCPCPVITFKDGVLSDETIQRWELYQSSVGYQVFTYSDHVALYHKFAEELQC